MRLPLSSDQSAHFIGVGGAGMSALAAILLRRGFRVSGSDLGGGPAARALEREGARVHVGRHDAAFLGQEAGMAIVSSAIRRDNPELVEARRLGLPIWHRAKMLSAVMDAAEDSLAVCGTHGKSTTSAMAALCMARAGWEPTAVLGAPLAALGGNALMGAGKRAVAEVDESDASFLTIRPTRAIVTNIDTDHLDCFGDERGLRDAFRLFLEGVQPEGSLVLCADCPNVRVMAERLERPFVTYGLFPRQADVRARSTDLRPGGSTFEVEWRGRPMGTVRLAVPGLHNVRNALAVIAALRLMEMDFADIARGLAEYRGVARRFELAGEESGVRVIDDYAHHPTEIQATLAAARGLGASGRVIALFQPHRYSRSKILAEEFGGAFDAADVALIADIYSAGERPIEGVDASLIFDSVRRHGHPFAWRARTLEDAAEWLASEVRSGDVVLTLGAGDVWKAGRKLLDLLRSEPAAEAETLARVAAEAV